MRVAFEPFALAPQNAWKSAKVLCTAILRVSTASTPAADHNPRNASIREASALGRISDGRFIARSSTRSGASGNPPPNMSHAL
jgi:hypothetical protein